MRHPEYPNIRRTRSGRGWGLALGLEQSSRRMPPQNIHFHNYFQQPHGKTLPHQYNNRNTGHIHNNTGNRP
jgi:hypothetical protein